MVATAGLPNISTFYKDTSDFLGLCSCTDSYVLKCVTAVVSPSCSLSFTAVHTKLEPVRPGYVGRRFSEDQSGSSSDVDSTCALAKESSLPYTGGVLVPGYPVTRHLAYAQHHLVCMSVTGALNEASVRVDIPFVLVACSFYAWCAINTRKYPKKQNTKL